MALSQLFGPRKTPRFQTVTAAFCHQVSYQPSAVAAKDLSALEPRQVTYAELSKRAAALARTLRELGVAPNDRVPLVVERSIEMLVGIVAILSCGAQYVLLDGGAAQDATLRHVIGQTTVIPRTVLALRSTRYRVDDLEMVNLVIIDEEEDAEEDLYSKALDPSNLAEPDGGCFVLHTPCG